MNNYWAFLPMEASNDLLGDTTALREKMDEDGYLYFRKLLDRETLLSARRDILRVLAEHGWVKGGSALMKGKVVAPPVREGEPEFLKVYADVQRLESFHTLAHNERLMSLMQKVLGENVFPHPLKIARLIFPATYEVSTPPHQDYLNNQGTERLTASWIPLGDCPMDLGGIAVLRGSHKFGVLPLEFHLGAGNRQSVVSEIMQDLRWVSTDFSLGDVLLFPALTVHASLHNTTEFFMRLSVDFRYQQEGEALTEMVLHPHFNILGWDEVYAGWQSDRYQYYWKDLDYEVVPFDRSGFDIDALRAEDIKALEDYERRRDVRYQRRRAALSAEDQENGDSSSGQSS